jgi:hypothetical protein
MVEMGKFCLVQALQFISRHVPLKIGYCFIHIWTI